MNGDMNRFAGVRGDGNSNAERLPTEKSSNDTLNFVVSPGDNYFWLFDRVWFRKLEPIFENFSVYGKTEERYTFGYNTENFNEYLESFGTIISQPSVRRVIVFDETFYVEVYLTEITTGVQQVAIKSAAKDLRTDRDIKNRIFGGLNIFPREIPSVLSLREYYHVLGQGIKWSKFSTVVDDVIHASAYPFIADYEKYIDDYISGDESVLLLIGIPGSGKTRLIRDILRRIQKKSAESISEIFYTRDNTVLESNDMFIDFFENNSPVMVLEDIDHDLKARKEFNPFMYKILSHSDGLIRRESNPKIILSTNLPSVKDIDSALLRPGRCYDVLHTRELTHEESLKFLSDAGCSDIILPEAFYPLAELYRIIKGRGDRINNIHEDRRVGF